MLCMSAKMFVYFPGGFGTLDELTEVLTLVQTGKMPKVPIILFGRKYWKSLDRVFLRKLYGNKLINKKDMDLYMITDDVKKIVKIANELKVPDDVNIYDGHNRF